MSFNLDLELSPDSELCWAISWFCFLLLYLLLRLFFSSLSVRPSLDVAQRRHRLWSCTTIKTWLVTTRTIAVWIVQWLPSTAKACPMTPRPLLSRSASSWLARYCFINFVLSFLWCRLLFLFFMTQPRVFYRSAIMPWAFLMVSSIFLFTTPKTVDVAVFFKNILHRLSCFFFSALDLEKVTQHLVGFLWFPGHTHTRALFAHAALSSHRSNSTVFFCFLSPSVSHCSPSHSFTFPIYLSSFFLGALCVFLQYLCACPSDGKEVVDGFVYLVVAAGLGGWWWWLLRWIEELIYQWK